MSEVKSGGTFWIFAAIIVACIAYINYGSATAVAAYVLFHLAAGICVIVSVIPFIGIFAYWYLAKFVGIVIMTSAGLPTASTLFTAILIYNGIFAFIVCFATTIYILWKVVERI